VKQTLVQLLCSPADRSLLNLEMKEEFRGEILEGYLRDCSGNRFRISEGIPRFAEDHASDETFEFKWCLIGDTYGYEERTRRVRQDWYIERFGFETRNKHLDFIRPKGPVLDAGTGTGVDAAMFAESGATVIAVDLSGEAASATYRHLGHLSNVHVIQADLANLPFPSRVFGYISCDQVLHHTPDPARSFSALARHLRPGGHMAVYVYRRKGPIREFTDDYLRAHTTKMTAQECYELCQSITLLGKALSELKTEMEVPADIPLLGIQAGPQDVQRFFYWNVMKCFWNDQYDFTTNVVINFDWYHPKYASRHTPEEVQGWFDRHGLEVERFNVVPSGIAAMGRMRNPMRNNE